MTNAENAKKWFLRTLLGAVVGAVGLAVILAATASEGEHPAAPAIIGIVYGAPLGAAIPGLFFLWFLFLTMVGQTSEAVRAGSRPRKKKRRVRQDEDDDDDDDDDD